MKHEVIFEPPDIIIMKLIGDWSPEEASTVYDKIDPLMNSTDKLKVLADVRKLGEVSPKTREIAAKRSRQYKVERIAVIGASAKVRMLGKLVFKLIPRIKESKFFDAEEEARAWLNVKN